MGILDKKDTGGMDLLHMGSLAIPIEGESERCVSVLLSRGYSELLERAVRAYVEASDKWEQDRNSADALQERRLTFVALLKLVSSGCEELATSVAANYNNS